MTDSFRDRADVQRRQIYHQQLLDSQRFGARNERSRAEPSPGARNDANSDGGLLTAGGGFVALVALPLTVLSALAALPAMLPVLLIDRALSGYWSADIAEAYVAAVIGILTYLTATLLIGIGVCVLHDELATLDSLSALTGAMFDLCSAALENLSAIGSGDLTVTKLFGVTGGEGNALLRSGAIAALHGPGIVLCAVVLCRWIGWPFRGVKGFAVACVMAAMVTPTSVALILWTAAQIIG